MGRTSLPLVARATLRRPGPSDRAPGVRYLARTSRERIARIKAAIKEYLLKWSRVPVVYALQALRGVKLVVAVTFATKISDISQYGTSCQLMGYLGLVLSER